MRKSVVISLLACAACAVSPVALAAPHRLHVAPGSIARDHSVRVYGSAFPGCARGDTVTLFSHAFKGATHTEFAGVPAIDATVHRHGRFSTRLTLSRHVKAGRYDIGARCGGGLLGHTTLHVRR